MGDFRKLEVWQKTQKLVSSVYKLTGTFPSAERYGLTSQMRRPAVDLQFLKSQSASGIVAEIHSIRGMLQNLHRALPFDAGEIVTFRL